MATRHQTIRTELDTDPLGRGYAGMTDKQASDDINTIYRPAEVAIGGMEADIRASGKWTSYRERSEAVDQDGVYLNQAMREFMDIFIASLPSYQATIRTSEGYVADLVDNMVTEGSMGAVAGAALKAYDNNRQSRGSELGVGEVTEGDIEYARSL